MFQQALNFAFKERYQRMFANYNPTTDPYKFFFGNLFAGGMAGATGLLFVYPLDFARTRLGVDIGKSVSDRQFKGMNDCLAKIYKADGIQGESKLTKKRKEKRVFILQVFIEVLPLVSPVFSFIGRSTLAVTMPVNLDDEFVSFFLLRKSFFF